MEQTKPLDGITVIDLTHLLAGPFCTMLLADAGATVLKIEPPTGEISRHRLPSFRTRSGENISAYFAAVNRGKQSVAIDLKSALGRRALHQLFANADVIVMNYRESALRRLEIEPERLHALFPRAVVASITAFGRTPGGKEASRPGLAIVAEAVSGITSLSQNDGAASPTWVGFALGDYVSGQAAFGAISAALVQSGRTGEGSCLDLSMTDALLAFNGIDLVREQAEAGQTERMSPVPYGVFPALDGHVVIGCNSDEFWQRLRAVADPGSQDPALTGLETAAARFERRNQVIKVISEWSSNLPRDQILDQLVAAGVPSAPVNSAADVLRFGYLYERGSLGRVQVDGGEEIVLPQGSLGVAVPPANGSPRLPALGEHTEQVLRERTDLSSAEVAELLRLPTNQRGR